MLADGTHIGNLVINKGWFYSRDVQQRLHENDGYKQIWDSWRPDENYRNLSYKIIFNENAKKYDQLNFSYDSLNYQIYRLSTVDSDMKLGLKDVNNVLLAEKNIFIKKDNVGQDNNQVNGYIHILDTLVQKLNAPEREMVSTVFQAKNHTGKFQDYKVGDRMVYEFPNDSDFEKFDIKFSDWLEVGQELETVYDSATPLVEGHFLTNNQGIVGGKPYQKTRVRVAEVSNRKLSLEILELPNNLTGYEGYRLSSDKTKGLAVYVKAKVINDELFDPNTGLLKIVPTYKRSVERNGAIVKSEVVNWKSTPIGVYSGGNGTITPKATVTTKFVNEEGVELKPKVISDFVNVGSNYQAENKVPEIEYKGKTYEFVRTEGQVSGQMTKEGKEVVHHYREKLSKITKWTDTKGKELKTQATNRDFEPAGTITGYKFVKTVTKDNTQTHLFKKDGNNNNIEDDLELTTKWLEKGTNKELKPSVVAEEGVGNYSEAGTIEGYTFDSTVNSVETKTRTHYFVKEITTKWVSGDKDLKPSQKGKTELPAGNITGYIFKTTEKRDNLVIHQFVAEKTTKWVSGDKELKPSQKSENFLPQGTIPGYIFKKSSTTGNTTVHQFVKEHTTKWVEEDSKKNLKEPKISEGPELAGDIKGYVLLGTNTKDNLTTHIFTPDTNSDGVADKNQQIETRWVDTKNKELRSKEVGLTAKPAGEIKGYKLVESKLEDQKPGGKISKVQTHIFHKLQTIFVDENGKNITPPVDGTLEPKEFPGYKLTGKSNDPNGDTRYTYHKIVTYYKDKNNKDILPKRENEHKIPEVITGYIHTNTETKENGDIVHYYKEVTTSYKDEDSKEIKPPVEGLKDPDSIEGYSFIKTNKDKDGNQSHTYHKIVTYHKDKNDKDLIPVTEGVIKPKIIPNYVFVETKTKENKDTVHYYREVTTSYKDENGKDIVPSKDGVHDPLEIKNYKLIEKNVDPKTGDIVYKYHKVTTRFLDLSGKEISPKQEGVQKAIEINNYIFKETKTNDKTGDIEHYYSVNEQKQTTPQPKQDIKTGVSVSKTLLPILTIPILSGGLILFAKKSKRK